MERRSFKDQLKIKMKKERLPPSEFGRWVKLSHLNRVKEMTWSAIWTSVKCKDFAPID